MQYYQEVVHSALMVPTMLAMYVDPGSGSYYFQMLIAGLTTVLFFFSSIKRKVLSLFNKTSEPPAGAPDASLKKTIESKDKSLTE
jgi:hypothetical protein